METYEDKNFNVRLEIRVKNAELVKAREALGLNQRQAAELIGTAPYVLGQLELLHRYPSKRMQEKICFAYRNAGYFILEEDVFPESLKQIKVKGKYITEREIPESNLISLSDTSQRLLPQVEPEAPNKIYGEEIHSAIINVLDELDERRRTAVMMHFGIDQDREYTFEEIGKYLGVGGARVGQLVNSALEKLKHPSRKKNLVEVFRDM
ncbi:MAG: sigma factor-like helix-turn-helix DNA-binding protein [Nanoarchaeota archaeon]|nr:sigma factor-like helix-turn-helix DNA-binding protein [Nanoarchaeota archaeon]